MAEANDYLLQFRKANEPWQSQVTTDNGLMLIQLSPAVYEVQVAARCTGGLLSIPSPMVSYGLSVEETDTEEETIYVNEDEEPKEPTIYEEPEPEPTDPLDDLILTVSYTDSKGEVRTYTSLPPNPSIEQLKKATQSLKPKCVALSTGYSCGVLPNPFGKSSRPFGCRVLTQGRRWIGYGKYHDGGGANRC